VVVDRDLDAAHVTACSLENEGIAIAADVTDETSIMQAMEASRKAFGELDIGVNAAGVGISVPLMEQSLEQWQSVQNINLAGLFLCCKHQYLQM
jgi:NAD(P)-dependent dehydrogenase (short-subunit alcohol dehydrogenase family)